MSALYYAIKGLHTNIANILVKKGSLYYFNCSDKQKDLSPIFISVILHNLDLLVLMLSDTKVEKNVLNSKG